MKTKIAFRIVSFIAAFTFAFTFFAITKNFHFFRKYDPQAQEKIYNFISKDRKLLMEMSEKIGTVPQIERIGIIKEYYEIREKQDVSELPEDFRDAWERKILSDVEWVNFMFHLRKFNGEGILKTKNQRDMADEKISESQRIENELESVSRSYGVEWDVNGLRKS